MNQLITQNLFLEKSCRFTLAYNDSVCSAMSRKESSGYSDIQEYKVHQEVSEMMFVKSFVHGIIPLVLMFFAGSWSDENSKRKPCILGPIIGELIAIICLIMNVVFLNQMPILLTSLAYTLPMAMSGGWPCLFLGLYSYVTTSTSAETLTMKIGSVVTTHNIAMIVGIGLAGILLNLLGFIGAYGATFFMILSSLVYGYYIIKDRKLIIPDIEDEIHNLEKTPKKLIKDFVKLEHFLDTAKVCFKKTEDDFRRIRMIAIIFLLMITYGPLQGEQNIMYLYTRLKFDWNEKDFAAFYAVQFGLQIFGSFLALIFLVKYLKWRDETLGILAFASSMLACGVYAFAYKGTIFYLGAVFDLFSGTAPIAMRSLISKLVHAHELGKTNSVFGICELLAHLIFTTLYITLYSKTLYIIPGAMFLITSVLKCLGIVIFIWLYRHSNRHRKHKKRNQHVKTFAASMK